MLYRIQETIFFRSDDGVVWLNDELRSSLTATTSRLLAYLLDNRHRVLTKDEILDKVWDAYGLSTSSNSLYKYISDLRAVFRSLGCEAEFITTVPKIGFMISPDIHVEKIGEINPVKQSNSPEVKGYEVEGQANDFHATEEVVPRAGHLFRYVKIILFFISLVLLVVLIEGGIKMVSERQEQKELFDLGKLETCQVKSFSAQDAVKSIEILRSIAENKRMKCSADSVYFVQFSAPVLAGKKGRVFVSQCRYAVRNSNSFTACENYYKADYEATP